MILQVNIPRHTVYYIIPKPDYNLKGFSTSPKRVCTCLAGSQQPEASGGSLRFKLPC